MKKKKITAFLEMNEKMHKTEDKEKELEHKVIIWVVFTAVLAPILIYMGMKTNQVFGAVVLIAVPVAAVLINYAKYEFYLLEKKSEKFREEFMKKLQRTNKKTEK